MAKTIQIRNVPDATHRLPPGRAYDAAYVALAKVLGATLLTRDARLAGAPGVRAHVELA